MTDESRTISIDIVNIPVKARVRKIGRYNTTYWRGKKFNWFRPLNWTLEPRVPVVQQAITRIRDDAKADAAQNKAFAEYLKAHPDLDVEQALTDILWAEVEKEFEAVGLPREVREANEIKAVLDFVAAQRGDDGYHDRALTEYLNRKP